MSRQITFAQQIILNGLREVYDRRVREEAAAELFASEVDQLMCSAALGSPFREKLRKEYEDALEIHRRTIRLRDAAKSEWAAAEEHPERIKEGIWPRGILRKGSHKSKLKPIHKKKWNGDEFSAAMHCRVLEKKLESQGQIRQRAKICKDFMDKYHVPDKPKLTAQQLADYIAHTRDQLDGYIMNHHESA